MISMHLLTWPSVVGAAGPSRLIGAVSDVTTRSPTRIARENPTDSSNGESPEIRFTGFTFEPPFSCHENRPARPK